MKTCKRLFTELDMLKIGARAYSAAVASLGLIKGLDVGAQFRGERAGGNDEPVEQVLVESLRKPLENLIPELVSLDVPVTLAAAARLKNKILGGGLSYRDMFSMCESVQLRLHDELEAKFLISLNKAEADEFVSDGFGDEVHEKFPSIVFELDEASKCMALGRYTAAVFHWMRSVESALRAVRLCLGATAPLAAQGRNWGNILNEIRDMRTGKAPRWPENDYFSAVASSIEAVMHAWRNSTMHIENKYTREEAESIRDCVKALLKRVASRMDEQGMPLA